MHINSVPRSIALPIALILAAPLMSGISPAFSETAMTTCQPPNVGEYLLLVVSPTTETQKQLRKALPSDLKTVNCKYLNETVTRIGGFNKMDDAKRWARYVNDIVGLSAIVTTRPTTALASTVPHVVIPKSSVASASLVAPTTETKAAGATKATKAIKAIKVSKTNLSSVTVPAKPAGKISYNPRSLGDGYAVLVDYFNRPELASSVQQVVEGNVGFVAYGQRPYLLAVYTTNQKEANNTLQKLNERGFFANLVDSSKVILLRSVVNVK
jgi:hypothetical protein